MAGQYAFLNVPALSAVEWHPFTISSAPGAPASTFHVRAMGAGSFTQRLRELSAAAPACGAGVDPGQTQSLGQETRP